MPQIIRTPHLSISSKNFLPGSVQAFYDLFISILTERAPQQSTKQDALQILWDIYFQGDFQDYFWELISVWLELD